MENSKITLTQGLPLLLFTYIFFYIVPFPFDNLSELPLLKHVGELYYKFFDWFTLLIGQNLLGLAELQKIELTGSGDTTFDYVSLVSNLLLAILLTIILLLVGLKQDAYQKIKAFIVTYARYFVGIMLLFYGLAKLFEGQFIGPGAPQLDKAYGDGSPMNLLWTFMGFSKPYTMFTGAAEILGGALLLFRKTTYLGCLVSIGVMANVVMLNFCYDVPVKLFSSHLLLLSIFILQPALVAIFNFFMKNETATLPAPPALEFSKRWMQIAKVILKWAIIIGFPISTVVQIKGYDMPQPNAMEGRYQPEWFAVNQDTMIQEISKDTLHWKKLMVGRFYSKVETLDGQSVFYKQELDTTTQILTLTSFRDSTEIHEFSYEWLQDDQILLEGIYLSDTIQALMNVKQPKDYTLMNRGFHWISEYPFNR